MHQERWQPHALVCLTLIYCDDGQHCGMCHVGMVRGCPWLWVCWRGSYGPSGLGLGKGGEAMGLYVSSDRAELAEVLLL